ncbi:MAG: NADH:ubiquinone reductase (Na(+)-transporting) subunit B [Bdellovibrionales bacterium]|jgi:Na+-transporting NADH:ubiquinone oxidoreductase subunit B|nr:NADH:ubiquinone reductase (Na(+)-transporting) subunit B [Bdellovibrionales bacterium]MBT3524669.1 NADH:ubiquinone reductase (Na(+)-transporting) subunit B [Bdellovibrionales bacterium]MBT7766711.1 NADH:ubiquinone reductase (Na(+)-transporting) subunit B [Bdellovibrionales bacterium]
MSILRNFLDQTEKSFKPGGKLEKFYPLFEALDTFAYTPGNVTTGTTAVRDGMDLKRLMSTVVVALLPALLMGMYNVGLQANLAMSGADISVIEGWRGPLYHAMGFGVDPSSICGNVMLGLLYFLPIYIVTNLAGLFWEVLFSVVRKHEVNEGFLVTGIIFPMILPATIPLWQVAVGISFGVVFAKEVFGGTGRNFLNPALTARAFLFFAYPAEISGDLVWVAMDGFTGATALSQAAAGGAAAITTSWQSAFIGLGAGSLAEGSTLACILGGVILLITRVGSWRIMLSILVGACAMALLFNTIGSATNPMFALTPAWHIVLGGFAFGAIFMASDPVTAANTLKGQYFYGLLIGIMVVLIRVVNPAFPEGMMLAILLGNIFAPLIDYFVIQSNIRRREARA